jgi:anti-sigma factor RsiW
LKHLGELAAAVVDGQLDDEGRERALAHLAACAECRAEVDAQRKLKARLRALGDDQALPAPSPELYERLAGIPQRPAIPAHAKPPRLPFSSPLRSRPGRGRGAPGAVGPRRPPARRGRAGTIRREAASRLRRTVAAGAGVVVVGLGVAFAVGNPGQPGPPVAPSVDRFAVEHAATTGEIPFTEPAVGVNVSASLTGVELTPASPTASPAASVAGRP